MTVRPARLLQTAVALVGIPAVLIGLWAVVVRAEVISPVFVPPPSRVAEAIGDLLADGTLLDSGRVTVVRTLEGWLLAIAVGTLGGLVLGRSAFMRAAFDPIIEFVRATPAAAIIPVFVLLLGPEGSTEVVIAGIAGTWPILINVTSAVRRVDPVLIDVARMCRLSAWRQATSIQLPASSSSVFAGMRISLSICFIVAVVVEMIGGTGGLGTELINARTRLRNDSVYAIIIVLGAVGVTINGLIEWAEKRLNRWQ